ncbi:glycosyltransferase family 2 protein [Psychroflexus tropicus]|uniref:glycosyltransferase family 2 protein n=1 Tax=Psychroflexus tropicus TaxID=197345 RepID=UPI00035F7354|nr:glycosyltransferase family A protein [Psychroflexus tropicus]
MKIAIIIPAYNEDEHIKSCLTSLFNQSYQASEILVVDDGSTDNTKSIVEFLCQTNNHLNLVSKDESHSHQPGSKIVDAFNYGLKHLNSEFDILCKFDADLIFPDDYLESLVQAFSENSNLGLYGGFCTILKEDAWIIEQLTNADHLRGALKAYRKQCFTDIGGLIPAMGWDTIDEMKARFRGWEVQTDSSLLVKHLKPTGQNYKKDLPALFGISLFRMRYSYALALLTCIKMAKNKADFGFFMKAMRAFVNAPKDLKQNTFLVTKEEGAFIRSYRWSKIKKRLL